MTNDSFKVGDIVILKSGGPDMTIQAIETERDIYYTCQWFAGKKLERGRFRKESLTVKV